MTTYLGIDLHKRSSVWVLIDQHKKVLKELNVPCTPEGVSKALTLLPDKETMQAAVEPVCGWRWFSSMLEDEGINVHIANPYKTRLIAESKLKNDRVDAKALAELLKVDYLPLSYKASDVINDARGMVRHRAYLVRVRTGVKNRIHGICARNGLHLTSEKPLHKEGLEKLLIHGSDELKDLVTVLKELDVHITKIETSMEVLVKSNNEIKLLMTMPGIGKITGCAIWAEVGDWKRFATPQALSSYAGLVPRQRSSGSSVHMGHITKVGSKVLRYSLVEASYRVRNTEKCKTLYEFYERLVPKGGAKKARVALARKMLTILWHMVRNNTPYSDRSLTSTQSVVISTRILMA